MHENNKKKLPYVSLEAPKTLRILGSTTRATGGATQEVFIVARLLPAIKPGNGETGQRP